MNSKKLQSTIEGADMSRETIHHRCGHTSIQKLFGNSKERARKAIWIGERSDCPDCEKAAFAAANAAAAIENADNGLPELTGSEKQIAWAETIRKGKLESIAVFITIVEKWHDTGEVYESTYGDKWGEGNPRARLMHVELSELVRELKTVDRAEAFIAIVHEKTDARWWIDGRDMSFAWIASNIRTEIDARIRSAVEEKIEALPSAQDAIAEATICPTGETVTKAVAEIRHVGAAIEVSFPEKRDDFREVIKAHGYTWKDPFWRLALDVTSGAAGDRLAEIAHRLVAAGFVVRLYDNEAREKAISGDFAPHCPRWVQKCASGKYAGWLLIKWGREDDLYHTARSLPGARYVSPVVAVPAGAVEAVAEFAERYDFRMSPGALEILEQHRAALAVGAVITDIKERPQAVSADYCGTPRPLTTPTDTVIDDDLRD